VTINPAFAEFLSFDATDRRSVFVEAEEVLGMPARYVEKDFYVGLVLSALFNARRSDDPRLLFKGGTSLSAGWSLISRFSEDVDISVFREDLGYVETVDELAAMGRRPRERILDGLRTACQQYLHGPLADQLVDIAKGIEAAAGLPAGTLRIEAASPDEDPDGQTLFVTYASLFDGDGYVAPRVKIESGARSDHDPCEDLVVTPSVASLVPDFDLAVPGVTTIRPERTLWDKLWILHETRQWAENRGEIRGNAHRLSRHYYDVGRLLTSPYGPGALEDLTMGRRCVEHGKVFFARKDHRLDLCQPGSFTLLPTSEMSRALAADYASMRGMIHGEVPSWQSILEAIASAEQTLNASPSWEPKVAAAPSFRP
jgi:hypothetical protein